MAQVRCAICEEFLDENTDYNGYRLQDHWTRRKYCTKLCWDRAHYHRGKYAVRIIHCRWCGVEFDGIRFDSEFAPLPGPAVRHCSKPCQKKYKQWNRRTTRRERVARNQNSSN